MRLRMAEPSDADDLFVWRNDPLTRAASRNTDPVEPPAHRRWFAQALADPARRILIGEDAEGKVGMVRFDALTDGWEVSINVAPARRGQGLGAAMLDRAMRDMRAGEPATPIIAHVRADNAASQRLFHRAGFRIVAVADGLQRLEHAENPRPGLR